MALYQHFSCNLENIGVFYPRCRPCLNTGQSTGPHTICQEIKNIAVEDLVLWSENPRDQISASAQDQDIAGMPGPGDRRRAFLKRNTGGGSENRCRRVLSYPTFDKNSQWFRYYLIPREIYFNFF